METSSAERRLSHIVGHIQPNTDSSYAVQALPVSANTNSNAPATKYEHILIEKKGLVGIVTLNRPKVLNALCAKLAYELSEAVYTFDKDPSVHAIIITGDKKAFAAGADIKEMAGMDFNKMRFEHETLSLFASLQATVKPIIAAVNGYAFGGGCELAMLCDIIIAGDNAQFGQPEIKIGTIPGLGGTQRLPRYVGKSKAMEMALTGNPIDAHTAEKAGLVSRVVPVDQTLNEAIKVANQIASLSKPIVAIAKESVNVAFESTLEEGLRFERRTFQSTFGLKDRKEGMEAFANKRKPQWTHQ